MSQISRTRSPRNRAKGFTLIEVLVSIAIFATLSVAAYQVVNQIQRSNEVSIERSARLNALQRSLVILDNDFRQMAQRQFRTNGEEASSKLILMQEYLLDSDTLGVMFTRLGWHNPQQQFPRGEVTKVGYRIKEETLERVWWRYPDTPTGQEGVVTPLLEGIEAFSLEFYNGSSWLKEWQTDGALPKAVRLKLTLKDYGEIERIYLTPSGSINTSDSSDSSSSSGGNNG
ncbi:type II secretion system minor pseudopilin GspJ [Vibrio sp. D404a]|uniref:type II secretion system minor pseudopilin GspJ n=1 Tax=unclassified Vibrio TaxID=2614977 RepID=UPI002555F580|nr:MULTISPECIES: type II secretion system minor pseudopilin GspJ [unclassified Vibrio]MDK9737801.1 type II secretion system minor pseudopilin GspJ [Vibrio sp. D404a]MDK9795403.1 type II secretion system minor pseudopilin GspJ [Vibrio sp. D449a]